MTRDEFMELVYETFADEPDNVLANGIIEAADAYVEHEKAQLYCEDTTSDTISRQAAIDVIEDYPHGNVWNVESMEEMVDKIKALPTIQPVATDTNVGDTISRQAAIDLCDWYDNPSMREDLEKLPSAQPEVKEGQWIRRDSGFDAECKCSVCGYRDFVQKNDTYWFNRNYCPNCGAKMKGAQNG